MRTNVIIAAAVAAIFAMGACSCGISSHHNADAMMFDDTEMSAGAELKSASGKGWTPRSNRGWVD